MTGAPALCHFKMIWGAAPDNQILINACSLNLTIANNYNKLSLSSGCTVPVEAERVTEQAALNCAEKYFDDEEKQGRPILTAMMAEFSISSRA